MLSAAMMRNQKMKSWRSVEQWLLGSMVLALAAAAWIWLVTVESTVNDGNRAGEVVTVRDCGVGLAAENAGRLFNAFFTTRSGGMGMGLSICRSIVDAHGGRPSASGNVGPGATFQFTLPLHREGNSP
jgi:signal transduction histidine kinase